MSKILGPLRWFYHEFGLVSIHDTGRNAYLIILARACRMFAYGTNSLILGESWVARSRDAGFSSWGELLKLISMSPMSQPSSSPPSTTRTTRSASL